MMEKIKSVLFDFDGTLVDIKIDFAEMKERILSLGRSYGISPKTELYVLESIDDIYCSIKQKDKSLAEEFKKQANQILIDIEINATLTSRAFPKSNETIRQIRNSGIKVGIVTRNCRPAVLKSSEIAGFEYDILLTRDDVDRVKPDPKHLLDALEILDSEPKNSIMVGDHPMDILAGKKAGMKTAAVLTVKSREDFIEVAPDFIFEDISGILEIL